MHHHINQSSQSPPSISAPHDIIDIAVNTIDIALICIALHFIDIAGKTIDIALCRPLISSTRSKLLSTRRSSCYLTRYLYLFDKYLPLIYFFLTRHFIWQQEYIWQGKWSLQIREIFDFRTRTGCFLSPSWESWWSLWDNDHQVCGKA